MSKKHTWFHSAPSFVIFCHGFGESIGRLFEMVLTDRKWSLPDDMQTLFFLAILQDVYPMRRVESKLGRFTFTSLPKGGLRVPFGAFPGLGIGFAIRR
jgi:hypothetical protein